MQFAPASDPADSPQHSNLTAGWRAIRLLTHLAYGALLALPYPHWPLAKRQQVLQRWSAALLARLHVRLHLDTASTPASRFWVANHVSWLDVFILNAVQPACFVAKSEVRHWPLLGWLSQRTGTLFIARELRRDTARVNREIIQKLEQGETVALFPEGTTSAGHSVGHFHASLLQSALDSGRAVTPVLLHHQDAAGKPCAVAAFIGDMSFVQSLWQILRCPELHVSVRVLPPIDHADDNRRLLAQAAQHAIQHALTETLSAS